MTFTEFMDAFAKFGIGEKRIKYVLSMWPDSHNTWEGLKIELMDMWESMQPTLSATEIRQMWRCVLRMAPTRKVGQTGLTDLA